LASLAGCSSTSGTSDTNEATVSRSPVTQPRIETVCHPELSKKQSTWEVTPTNFDVERIAVRLGVPYNDIAQGGRYGRAICDKPLDVDRIGSSNGAPIVTVPGEGQPCLVIGTRDRPVHGAVTAHVIAICANSPSPTRV
jgi:hypothetical protein